MLLDVDNAIPYLIAHGYLTPRDVVDTGVRATSASRRNRNVRVERRDGSGLLVKQAEAAGAKETLGAEAGFYRMCTRDARAAAVRPVVPTLRGVEAHDGAIVIDLVARGVPLGAYVERFGDAALLGALGGAIGRALGTYHRAFRGLEPATGRDIPKLPSGAPWVLWVHRPGPEVLAELSAANRRTLQILQQNTDVARRLDGLRRMWRVETLIHGDLKADNLLVVGDVAGGGDLDVKLVDWELVQLGDPAWDVAAMLQDFVLAWILSMPVARGMSPADMAAGARYPLAGFQHGTRAMWRAYMAASDLADDGADTLRTRAAGYAAARLVQSAYESGQRAGALGNHEVMMLQVAANVMADAEHAARHLFGIPARGALR